jgi:Secretion system C-terminal sorting domain
MRLFHSVLFLLFTSSYLLGQNYTKVLLSSSQNPTNQFGYSSYRNQVLDADGFVIESQLFVLQSTGWEIQDRSISVNNASGKPTKTTSIGIFGTKEVNMEYNAAGLKTKEERSLINTNGVGQIEFTLMHEYDVAGNVTLSDGKTYSNTNQLVSSFLDNRTYDASSRLLSVQTQFFQSPSFQIENRTTNQYTSTGVTDGSFLNETKDPITNQWVPTSRGTFTTNSNIRTMIQEAFIGGVWVKTTRTIRENGANGSHLTTVANWQSATSTWADATRRKDDFNAENINILAIDEVWDSASNGWKEKFKFITTAIGTKKTREQNWDFNNQTGQLYLKAQFDYDYTFLIQAPVMVTSQAAEAGRNFIKKETQLALKSIDALGDDTRTSRTLNAQGHTLTEKIDRKVGADWKVAYQVTHTNTPNGKPTAINYLFENGTVAGSKEFEYFPSGNLKKVVEQGLVRSSAALQKNASTEYTYTSQGMVESEAIQQFFVDTPILGSKKMFQYDAQGRPQTITYSVIDNGSFVNASRENFTYSGVDARPIIIDVQNWNKTANTFDPSKKRFTFSYAASSTTKFTSALNSTNTWQIEAREVKYRNQSNDLHLVENWAYNITAQAWEPISKRELTFESDHSIKTEVQYILNELKQLYPNVKHVYAYGNTTAVSSIFDALPTEVYPNPFTTSFQLQTAEDANFQIISQDGKVLKQGLIGNTSLPIDASQMPNGIYYLKVQNDQGQSVTPIVKQ